MLDADPPPLSDEENDKLRVRAAKNRLRHVSARGLTAELYASFLYDDFLYGRAELDKIRLIGLASGLAVGAVLGVIVFHLDTEPGTGAASPSIATQTAPPPPTPSNSPETTTTSASSSATPAATSNVVSTDEVPSPYDTPTTDELFRQHEDSKDAAYLNTVDEASVYPGGQPCMTSLNRYIRGYCAMTIFGIMKKNSIDAGDKDALKNFRRALDISQITPPRTCSAIMQSFKAASSQSNTDVVAAITKRADEIGNASMKDIDSSMTDYQRAQVWCDGAISESQSN